MQSGVRQFLTALSIAAFLSTHNLFSAETILEFSFTSHRGENQTGIFHCDKYGENPLTKGISIAEAPSWSPDGREFAFQAKVNGVWDIFVKNIDTNEVRNLTNDAEVDTHPVWSSVGSTIAFNSDRKRPKTVRFIDSDGRNLRKLLISIGGTANFCWSPDAERIAVVTSGQFYPSLHPPIENIKALDREVWLASREGKDARRLTNTGGTAMNPAWSPDQMQIAFAFCIKPGDLTNIQICRINVDGTGFKQLTDDPGQNLCPKWTTDSKQILYYNQPPGDGQIPRIMCLRSDGSEKEMIDVGEPGGYFPDIPRQSLKKRSPDYAVPVIPRTNSGRTSQPLRDVRRRGSSCDRYMVAKTHRAVRS